MTHDQVKKAPRRPSRPSTPWEQTPGTFHGNLEGLSSETLVSLQATSMDEAISRIAAHFAEYPSDSRLIVRRDDRSESYKGRLR